MRALIFDLDNTLLDRSRKLSRANRVALRHARELGYALVIATSRPIRAVRQLVPGELLSTSIVISMNGAVAWPDAGAAPQHYGSIGTALPELLEALARTADEASYSLETDGQRFALSHPLSEPELWSLHSATPEMVVPVTSLTHQQVTKIAVDGRGRTIHATIGLARRYPDLRFIPSDAHTFVGIVPATIDKSLTLLAIAHQRGIDLTASIAFGDDLPDRDMLSIVGTGVAMGNAVPEVKSAADAVIGDCDSDAIARFLAESVLR